MFDLFESSATATKVSTDSNSFDSPFDFLLEEDSALMTEQMAFGQSGSPQTPEETASPFQAQARGSCHNNNNNVVATPPVQDDDVNQQNNGFVATPPPALNEEDVTDVAIQQLLDAGGEFSFEFNDQVYTLRLGDDGQYKAFDEDNNIVDQAVRIQDNLTVAGFVEVGGLSGLNGGDRLYIGRDPGTGELAFIEATAELDANDAQVGGRTHLETLLQTGKQHAPALVNADNNNNNNNNGNLFTPPLVQNNDLDQNANFATPLPPQSEPDVPEGFIPESEVDTVATISVFDQILGEGWNDPSNSRQDAPTSFDLLLGEGWNQVASNTNPSNPNNALSPFDVILSQD